jgi:hypothetical protein
MVNRRNRFGRKVGNVRSRMAARTGNRTRNTGHGISRRRFLGTAAAGVGAMTLGASGVARAASGNILNVPSPYATIQDAVDASQPGDTIMIGPGNHPGAFLDNKSNISIVGSGEDVTYIDPIDVVVHTIGFMVSPFAEVPSHNIKISNLTIEHEHVVIPGTDTTSVSIYAFGSCNGWEISNVTIRNSHQPITNWSGNGWKISENRVESSYYGIALGGALERGVSLNNNIISNNTCVLQAGLSVEAIAIWNEDLPLENVVQNVITNNTVTGFGDIALWLIDCKNTNMSRNDLSGFTAFFAQGIVTGIDNLVSNNDYGPSYFTGIYCLGSNNQFTNDNFLGNYLGWDPSFNGCILLEVGSEQNQVTALKNGIVMHGFDLCNQVYDANLDYEPYTTNNSVPGYEKCSNKKSIDFITNMQLKAAELSDKIEQKRQKMQ